MIQFEDRQEHEYGTNRDHTGKRVFIDIPFTDRRIVIFVYKMSKDDEVLGYSFDITLWF